MTNKEAIRQLNIIKESLMSCGGCKGGQQSLTCISKAIKALDLLARLEGFKYVTTDVMLRENEMVHFDIYKKGWNNAIDAVKAASDRPLSEIFNAINESEVKEAGDD